MSAQTKAEKNVFITPPNYQRHTFVIRGTAPYVQNKFSAKARIRMKEDQEKGSAQKKSRKKEPKNFQEIYEGAMHIAEEGWHGIPVNCFRAAMVEIGYRKFKIPMTITKGAVFVLPAGFDKEDGTPLSRITKGKPHYHEAHVNIRGSADICPRPMWDQGWEAEVIAQWDADQFTAEEVANLIVHAGVAIGAGCGRPSSKTSVGMGWGTYELIMDGGSKK